MTSKNVFKGLGYAALLALPMLVTSCDENEEFQSPVIRWDLPSDTIMALNDQLTLSPEVHSVDSATAVYLWSVDGNQVSADKNYVFTATETGSHLIALTVTDKGGVSQKQIKVEVRKYYGGFYMINEGWFGHHNASFNYFKNDSALFATYDKFAAAHPDITLGATGVVGALQGKDFYVLSKNEPYLTKLDAITMTQTATLNLSNGASLYSPCNMCFLNDGSMIMTTYRGAYKVNPETMTVTDTITTDKTTDIIQKGDYLYMLVKDSVNIYKASDLTPVVTRAAKATTGFAVTGNTVWAANGSDLLKIEGENVSTVTLPDGYGVYYDRSAYHSTSLQASKDGKSLLFVKNDGWTNKVAACYHIAENKVTEFLKSTDEFSFYGAGIQVNPKTGDVYLIYTEDGWGSHYMNNRIIVTNAEGQPKDTLDYSGEYWFPSSLVFETR